MINNSSHGEDLLRPNGSVLTGTTSHQHYRPPHQPPGHDLVIDLKGQEKLECSPAAGSGNRMPQRDAAAVPLGHLSPWQAAWRAQCLSHVPLALPALSFSARAASEKVRLLHRGGQCAAQSSRPSRGLPAQPAKEHDLVVIAFSGTERKAMSSCPWTSARDVSGTSISLHRLALALNQIRQRT
jgi:hypothetical protein